MQYAHLFKHLPGSIECFDMNPIGIETADPTKPYHDLLILKASAHVITEVWSEVTAKEQRLHKCRARCSPRGRVLHRGYMKFLLDA
ncbi:hypothetical protein D918_07773 [Trichuris suis]|nr:hypothetical protein D918_07773 [Trichuris suis]